MSFTIKTWVGRVYFWKEDPLSQKPWCVRATPPGQVSLREESHSGVSHHKLGSCSLSAAIGDGGASRDREPVRGAAGGDGEGQEGGDGDPGGRGEAGAEAGRGHPGSPGAEVHGPEEDSGAGGEDFQEQERCGFLTGNVRVQVVEGSNTNKGNDPEWLRVRKHWFQFIIRSNRYLNSFTSSSLSSVSPASFLTPSKGPISKLDPFTL